MNECTISGTISHVIYQNEENGYTVLRLVTSDGEAVTAVGSIPFAAPGEDLAADDAVLPVLGTLTVTAMEDGADV